MKLLYLILFMVLTVFNAYGQEATAWEFPTGAGVYSSPVADADCIYVGSNDSCLYALSKKRGSAQMEIQNQRTTQVNTIDLQRERNFQQY